MPEFIDVRDLPAEQVQFLQQLPQEQQMQQGVNVFQYILYVPDSPRIWMYERTMDTLIKIFQICLFCWKAMI